MTYSQICANLLKSLPDKQREIITRRFALAGNNAERETLEAIGKSHSITRERVRQIESDGILRLKSQLKKYQKDLAVFQSFIKKSGGLKREDLLLEQLGQKDKNQVYFLLAISPNFKRFGENDELHSFWTINEASVLSAKKTIAELYGKLKKAGKPMSLGKIASAKSGSLASYVSHIEISKKIQQNQEGLFGLSDWPEINPKGIKDKAYLVFKKESRPLHFNEVASLIGRALPQTVHNELIKDARFILVGRGLYALQEWGYESGCVKDVIAKVLKNSKKPLTKDEIVEKVLKQRFVKENTISLNLSNRNNFFRNSDGSYIVREA